MRVLLMSRIIGKTGVGNHMKQLAGELVRQGHSVWVVSSTDDLQIGLLDGVSFQKIELRTKNPVRVCKNVRALLRLIRDERIEIVHCHHRMASLYMSLCSRFRRIPYVYTLHLAPIPHTLLHRAFTRYGNRAIAISQETGAFLQDGLGVPGDRISYVLNGVDPSLLTKPSPEERSRLRERFGIPEGRTVVAMHSRIAAVKNHLAMVEAVRLLSDAERARLLILCSGETRGDYYEALRAAIARYGLQDSFRFCGWVAPREILGAADALFLPSLSEGFPLNCIEAMFMDVPVTRSKTAGYADVRDYVVGLEDTSPGTIAAHLQRTVCGQEYPPGLTAAAKRFVQETCTVEIMTKKTVAVYQSVLEQIR